MFRKKIKVFSEAEIKALEERCKNIRQTVANPNNTEFHDKLKNLLNAKVDSRDNFINWITGLTTGAIFLLLNKIYPGMADKELPILIIVVLFLTIFSAFLFKIFLEVRYSSEEFDVTLLKNIWEGHDIKTRLQDLAKQGKVITEEERQKFYRNLNETLSYLDSDFLARTKKPVNIKSKLLTLFYGLSIFLFLLGITLMIIYFISVILKPPV
jgi:hypothetical protein